MTVRQHVQTENKDQWEVFLSQPYKDGIWAEKYPSLAAVTSAFDTKDSVSFAVYPAGSVVENNLIIQRNENCLEIAKEVHMFSHVGNNPRYCTAEEAGFDMDTLKFILQPEFFPEIPVEQIGRIK